MVVWFWLVVTGVRGGDESEQAKASAYLTYQKAEATYTNAPADLESAWQFGRACFDWAEFSTNNAQRAALAEQGIQACEQALALDPDSVGGLFYLGMNQGQLARTMGLGALKLVSRMEALFQQARELDSKFEYAGPDRNLGLLYLQAPGWPVSVGNRSKARAHLRKAVELAPLYPGNRLNLMEAYDKWNDLNSLRRELSDWKKLQDKAREEFDGESWADEWIEWDQRLQAFAERLDSAPPDLRTPKGKW